MSENGILTWVYCNEQLTFANDPMEYWGKHFVVVVVVVAVASHNMNLAFHQHQLPQHPMT